MAKVKLGSKEFAVDSEIIDANYCGVTDADCVALAALMKSGKMLRLQRLNLVRLFSVFFVAFPPSPHVPSCACGSPPLIRIISQDNNNIGADGARAIADAIRTNSSVRELYLVRMCCR